MPNPLPKVTLEYNVGNSLYHIATIQGNKPSVDYSTADTALTARVGDWLSETDAELLGLAATLVIKRYTV